MRSKKFIRNRVRRGLKPPMEVDITSLLDILVILLVFLLKSYDSSGIIFNVSKDITLPKSTSIDINNLGVVIQVSEEKLWVDDKTVLDFTIADNKSFDDGGRRIVSLFDELSSKKQAVEQISQVSPDAKPFSGVVNLIVDKSIKYTRIRQVLYTCAEAGFLKYKFVVLGEND
jgi:biopolymer transport protein ExbD